MSRYRNQIYTTVNPTVFDAPRTAIARTLGDSIPKSGLLAYLKGDTTTVGESTVLRDSASSGADATVQLARAYTGDGTGYIAIAGLLTTDTIEVPTGSDTPTCTTNGQLDIASGETAWGITIKRGGDTIAYYPCAEGSGEVAVNCYPDVTNALPHGTLTSITEATWHTTHKDGTTGYNLNVDGYSVADSHATLADDALIPAVPGTSVDPFGDALDYNGPIRLSPTYTGYTGTWDGTAYGVLAETVTFNSSEDFSIETVLTTVDGNTNSIIGGSIGSWEAAFFINASNYINFDGVSVDPDTLFAHPVSTPVKIRISRVSNVLNLYVNDVLQTHTPSHSASVTINLLGRHLGTLHTGQLHYIKIYNASGTLIHHWVCEASPTSEQEIIYDVVGGNHATLTSATTPFFTTASERATYLLEYGWRDDSGTIIPGTSSGVAADSNALTTQPNTIAAIGAGYINWPQDKRLIADDPSDTLFDASGDAQDLTLATMQGWTDDRVNGQIFYGAKGIAYYDSDQSATVESKLERILDMETS